jgi:hypothetical protein
MQQFFSLLFWRLFTAQHVSGSFPPEACWAVNERQDNKVENCCIRLVIYLNCTVMHRLTNLKFKTHFMSSNIFFFETLAVYDILWKILYSQAGCSWKYGACALHAGHLRLSENVIFISFPLRTVVSSTRLIVTFIRTLPVLFNIWGLA